MGSPYSSLAIPLWTWSKSAANSACWYVPFITSWWGIITSLQGFKPAWYLFSTVGWYFVRCLALSENTCCLSSSLIRRIESDWSTALIFLQSLLILVCYGSHGKLKIKVETFIKSLLRFSKKVVLKQTNQEYLLKDQMNYFS